MRTVYDAYFAELEGDETNADVIEDIKVLMQAFDGESEQVILEKLLKSIEAGTADIEQIADVITEVETSYRAKLNEDEDWFLLYGEWNTCLIGDIYVKNDEYIFEDLASLQKLAENAPEIVSEQILMPVSGLSRFNEQDAFSAEDYEEMTAAAFNVFDLVFGE